MMRIRRGIFFIVVGVLIFGMSRYSFAKIHGSRSGTEMYQQMAQSDTGQHSHKAMSDPQAIAEFAVKVENTVCPVLGEKIDEKMKATYEYQGKIYNFCCASCIDEFKKDPEKFIKKVEEELKATTDEEKGLIPEPKVSESMHEGHHR